MLSSFHMVLAVEGHRSSESHEVPPPFFIATFQAQVPIRFFIFGDLVFFYLSDYYGDSDLRESPATGKEEGI